MKQKVLLMLLTLIAIFVFGCGKKASHEAVNNPADDVTCAITDNEAVCDDGNVYIVPEDVDVTPSIDSDVDVDIIIIVTVPASEDDPEAICEKDNRNGRKCRKRKKKHGGKK